MALILIEEGGFKFEQSTAESVDFWDLSQLVVVNHKDGSKTKEWKIVSYGISLARCINTIIGIRVRMKHADKIKHLKDFLDAYRKEKLEVLKFFKLLDEPKLEKDFIDGYKESSTES